ncbi:hypothetical protein G6O69_11185 [Pseudenhygromyxa sp. WMMC2535]|uniref:hypothetical protein n=1 Tax=Pseudenhygromyxa sp. WMMC2535 TaxID=2712867 RepID=UPI001551876B|nr:hypothetical protein [Pseudenhygromyxa sp. WMMC2535]NVB38395.1 hypothetical protein [Pseudenhygromyxa sp. WMMC2535]
MSRSPQLGYNHNIPHRGRLYHVQTEDSGVKKAHIFTHVFYDGTIISSNKVTYDPEGVAAEDLDQHIVGLMQESHKGMIRQLRRGEFDEKIIKYIGEHPEAAKSADGAAPAAPAAKVAVAPASEEDEDKRPERRPAPEPREVERQGPPLATGHPGPTVDPSLTHPAFSSREAQAQVAASASGKGPKRPSRGPSRVRRRAIGGIGGRGVAADQAQKAKIAERRDIIVGKFASEHQAQLDEEILSLLREE